MARRLKEHQGTGKGETGVIGPFGSDPLPEFVPSNPLDLVSISKNTIEPLLDGITDVNLKREANCAFGTLFNILEKNL